MESKKGILGKKIENVEELEKVSEIITIKALKIIESKGNKYASNILDYKKSYCLDIFEDLKSEVIIKIIENDYIITKECFKIVNNYLYNIKKERIEIIINTETETEEGKALLNKDSYIKFINEEHNETEQTETMPFYEILEKLNLTEKQKEILLIYSKVYNFSKVADILGITKSSVSNTIYRIKDKIKMLDFKIA